MSYHRWTVAEESIIRDYYQKGQRWGIRKELCMKLGVSDCQLKEHLRKMKQGGRLLIRKKQYGI